MQYPKLPAVQGGGFFFPPGGAEGHRRGAGQCAEASAAERGWSSLIRSM